MAKTGQCRGQNRAVPCSYEQQINRKNKYLNRQQQIRHRILKNRANR